MLCAAKADHIVTLIRKGTAQQIIAFQRHSVAHKRQAMVKQFVASLLIASHWQSIVLICLTAHRQSLALTINAESGSQHSTGEAGNCIAMCGRYTTKHIPHCVGKTKNSNAVVERGMRIYVRSHGG